MALGGGLQPGRRAGGDRRRSGGPAEEVPGRGARALERSPLPGPLSLAASMAPPARLRLPPPAQDPFLPTLAGSPASATAPSAAHVWELGAARLLQRSDSRASPRRAPPPRSPQARQARAAAAPRAKLSLLLLRPSPAAQPALGGGPLANSLREGTTGAGYYSEKRIAEWINQVNRSLFAPSGVLDPPEQDKSIGTAHEDPGSLPLPSPGVRECLSQKGRSATPSFDRRGN
ncbi:uncharacterized protein LOC116422859 [Sarcophilus harrisii]|uniref:uncharacterized protein LOC116422859 n=1 Tax=Sarcophilus harrisii TaxID=9305 RepID=UPI001301C338|nr:uncharacterized protein LOC116422859 [Sarcophilus harrisii]